MKPNRVFLATIISGTVLGVSLSGLHTVAQIRDFRPIRVSGSWTLGGEQGTWSAELGLDRRLLSGDVTVVGANEEALDTGRIEVAMTSDRVVDGEILLDGEVVASVTGVVMRGAVIEGTVRAANGEEG